MVSVFEQILQISIRIKELRQICEYTVEQAARAAGVTAEEYLDYEEGRADIPISVLYALAGFYNVELTTILTGGDPHLHKYTLVRKGDGVEIDRRKAYKYNSLAYKFIGKRMEPLFVTAPPEKDDEPISLSIHEGQEFEYVLSGRMKLVLGEEEFILNEGDCIYFDSSQPHGMRSVGEEDATFLAIIL